MLSINPQLEPEQLRILLRRSAMTIGGETDFEAADADDLTSPILPSERNNDLNHPDVGHSARLDMHKALDLTVQSLKRVRLQRKNLLTERSLICKITYTLNTKVWMSAYITSVIPTR